MERPELYHGTDVRMIEMSEEERQHFFDACNLVIESIFPFYVPLLQFVKEKVKIGNETVYVNTITVLQQKYEKILDEKGGPYTYLNLYEKLKMIEWRNNNADLYQYQNLYLTSVKPKAFNYARSSYAGCELGLIAYQVIKGADIIGLDNFQPDKETKKAIDFIKEFGKEGNGRPVIVTLKDYDESALTHGNGKPLDQQIVELWHKKPEVDFIFRYNKVIDLTKCKIENVTEELYKKMKEEYKDYPF